jgi:hypothetical protein
MPDICRKNHGGNLESELANAQNRPHRHGQYLAIFEALLSHPDGMTEEEISTLCNFRRHSTSARLSELKKAEFVMPRPLWPSGYHRRKTTSGSFAAVLVINPNILAELAMEN